MEKRVTLPPHNTWIQGRKVGGWWHSQGDRVVCDLCPRGCCLYEGARGFCGARSNVQGQMVLDVYGHSTGVCIDPVEKKPLYHFHPGSSVLSFGTAGCNLACKFCESWQVTRSRELLKQLGTPASPRLLAETAQRLACRSVAFTYNDPVIWVEYAIDTAQWCRRLGLNTIAVTAGYVNPSVRPVFFRELDAVNVDLKAFSDHFYEHLTLGHLQPVLDTLRWIRHESSVWLEITTLIIPGKNDARDDIERMCGWIVEDLGDDVPLHFTQFHPNYRMRDREPTPPATLIDAREIALRSGLKYVYTGNVYDPDRQSTYCPNCGSLLVERNANHPGQYGISRGKCGSCGYTIAGHFEEVLPASDSGPLAMDPASVLHELEAMRGTTDLPQ